jgi:hypothetical protein
MSSLLMFGSHFNLGHVGQERDSRMSSIYGSDFSIPTSCTIDDVRSQRVGLREFQHTEHFGLGDGSGTSSTPASTHHSSYARLDHVASTLTLEQRRNKQRHSSVIRLSPPDEKSLAEPALLRPSTTTYYARPSSFKPHSFSNNIIPPALESESVIPKPSPSIFPSRWVNTGKKNQGVMRW